MADTVLKKEDNNKIRPKPYFLFWGDVMEDTKSESKFYQFVKEYVPYLVLLVLILLFKHYLYSPVYVNGESMMSTLHDGDVMILDIVGSRNSHFQRFDIVVVDNGKELIIKRVIGLPGEHIQYLNHQLYINEKVVEDPYASNETDDFDVIVPKDEYFVMGDNRQNSMDSRYFGTFSKEKILGRTSFVIFPFGRFGNKK